MFETAIAIAMPYVIPIAGAVLTTGFGWIGTQLSGLIRTKTDNAKASRAMESLTHLVANVVAETEMKKGDLSDMMKNGKLTAEGRSYLKGKAMNAVMNQLPEPTRKIAEGVVNDLYFYIGTKIEAAVLKQKANRPIEAISSYISGN